ncbi:phosphate ABC transporter, permease protein PstA [Finegoldia magna]|uniref:Phosphate transport system permease protein PstA n=1 Tax=Finegoldia magna TaxID=1260 RepID=A0A233V6I1_FINMA|nr:phosphate ABC transporter permease PstA [Finegoldia magna]MDU5223468.1 phosphate ABC transporter permease PstA [Finegoldia magna]OXZ27997.1 phosphate ABC transporter, permease protein PstA [Finegoldia magna]
MENNSIDVSTNSLKNLRKNKTKSKIIKGFIYLMAFITLAVLFYLIIYMLVSGIPHLKPSMFSNHYTSKNVSMMPSIKTTIMLVLLTLLIASPIGIFTAIYLSEYSKKNSKVVTLIRLATETLSGIPSIVYGLFGMLLFVMRLKFRYSLISGVLTMFIMVLPLIIRASEQALLSIDDELRAGSYALGAGKLYTIRKVLLPVAMPGIMAGIILSIGRVVGETAALMFTLGTDPRVPSSLMQSGRSLALHMYVLASEGFHVEESYATGVVLVILVLIINIVSNLIGKKLTKGSK